MNFHLSMGKKGRLFYLRKGKLEHHAPTSWLLQIPGLSHDPQFLHVNATLVLTAGISIFALLANRYIKGREKEFIVPPEKLTLTNLADVVVEGVYNMVSGTLGSHTKDYFPYVGALFLFILFSNLMGLIPFGAAPTGNINTNLALGLSSFVFYNYMGIKSHGLKGYLAHFLMGLGPLGIFVAFFEIISHVLRPITLTLRLLLNLYIDHQVAHTFELLLAWLLPVPLLLFGIVVCTIQAFVFATLTAVYIQLATEHEAH